MRERAKASTTATRYAARASSKLLTAEQRGRNSLPQRIQTGSPSTESQSIRTTVISYSQLHQRASGGARMVEFQRTRYRGRKYLLRACWILISILRTARSA